MNTLSEVSENLFEGVELSTPSNNNVKTRDVIQTNAPSMLSSEWHDYAMSLFDESELVDGHPLVAGLRRVSELVLGPIVFSGPTQVFPVQRDDHHGRATVVFTVEFANGMKYAEVADSWEGNTDDTFCAYAVAIASTRAEARALRKALKIKGVAAEELTKKDTAKIVRQISSTNTNTDGDYDNQARMSDAQLNFIDVKCKQLNIDGTKLLKEEFSVSIDKKITKKVASDIIDKLNDYQRDKSNISESLIGYKQEWRNT
jgi:hypothetical protein